MSTIAYCYLLGFVVRYFRYVNDTTERIVRKYLALLSQTNVASVAIGLRPPSKLDNLL